MNATIRIRRPAVAAVAVGAALWATAGFAATAGPDDPYFTGGQQWALTGVTASIRAPEAWCASTGTGVLIADVDSGADFMHPDLGGRLIVGARFTSGRGDPAHPDATGTDAVQDDNGHGTMTTGIMVAATDNGQGMAAVAPGAQALVVKVLSKDGSGYSADVAAGIEYAVSRGARVINLSLGPEVPLTGALDGGIADAIDYAAQHGVAVAIAAGNNSLPLSDYQLSRVESEALVVGAVGPDGSIAHYSTRGAGVNVYAPGGDDQQGARGMVITTTLGGGYVEAEGTSFAAPHAAGSLALLMAHGLKAADARQAVIDSADMRQGSPELDVARALASTKACGASGGVAGATASRGGATESAPPAPQSSPPPSPVGEAPSTYPSEAFGLGIPAADVGPPWPLIVGSVLILGCLAAALYAGRRGSP